MESHSGSKDLLGKKTAGAPEVCHSREGRLAAVVGWIICSVRYREARTCPSKYTAVEHIK